MEFSQAPPPLPPSLPAAPSPLPTKPKSLKGWQTFVKVLGIACLVFSLYPLWTLASLRMSDGQGANQFSEFQAQMMPEGEAREEFLRTQELSQQLNEKMIKEARLPEPWLSLNGVAQFVLLLAAGILLLRRSAWARWLILLFALVVIADVVFQLSKVDVYEHYMSEMMEIMEVDFEREAAQGESLLSAQPDGESKEDFIQGEEEIEGETSSPILAEIEIQERITDPEGGVQVRVENQVMGVFEGMFRGMMIGSILSMLILPLALLICVFLPKVGQVFAQAKRESQTS